MNAEHWARLKPLFHGAMDRPEAERDAWLRDASGGDEALLVQARALLHAHATAGAFLAQPVDVDPAEVAAAETPALDDAAWPPGHRVGDYEIEGIVGRGGMGIVYLAVDRRLVRPVALKALQTGLASQPQLRERLTREARAAATIADPAVATVYSLEDIDGQLLLASEYVDGPSLRAVLANGALPTARAWTVALDIAKGLRAVHAAGIVHRDLKPENILLPPDGGAKLVDFGIAVTTELDRTRLTREGALIGTPAYMAPEQLLGERADARSDIFAFGVILQEMLSGRHPLSPPGAQERTPDDDPSWSGLQQVAARARQTDPQGRYATAAELVAAVEDTAAAGVPVATGVGGSPSRFWWEFHQGAAAISYAAMLVPAWLARGVIGGAEGRSFFLATACAALVASMLRLHLWFTSRQHPRQLPWARQRSAPWIRLADVLLVASLVIGAGLVAATSPLDVVLLLLAVGTAVAFMLIEPATARAAGLERRR